MTPFDRRMLLLTIIVVAVVFGYWLNSISYNQGRSAGINEVLSDYALGNETLGQLLYEGIIESIEEADDATE